MKKAVRYSIAGVLAVLFCIGMALLYGHVRRDQAAAVCTGLQVGFTDSLRFVSEDDIREYLDTRYGAYVGERIDSVQLARIEDLLWQRDVIEHELSSISETMSALLLKMKEGGSDD